jgi:hypothetical protein
MNVYQAETKAKEDAVRRDLELILLGAAIGKGEARQRILDGLPPGFATAEIGKLLNAVREQNPIPIGNWLSERKCKCEKGKDFIQVILDRLIESNQKERIKEIIRELEIAAKLETVEEMKARVVSKLQQIGDMP